MVPLIRCCYQCVVAFCEYGYRVKNARASPTERSAIAYASNRPGRLPGVDGRSELARRFEDLTSGPKSDIGRALSAAEESLIDQAAALMIQREVMTAASALGEPIDAKELVRISGAVGRTLAALGLTKRPVRVILGGPPVPNPMNGNDKAALSISEIANKTEQLLKRARHSCNPELFAIAARVLEIFETARRRKDAKASTKQDGLACS